jgi:hypothetical protein
MFYHCAPLDFRAAIFERGLVAGPLGGVYLWIDIDHAEQYALWFDDVWQVDATGLPLVPDPDHAASVVAPHGVPAHRLRLVRRA